MADFHKSVTAFPANLRGKEQAIPAGYLHENKETAGIAGIETNPKKFWKKFFACALRDCARPKNNMAGCYPRYPRRTRVFNNLSCGDRFGYIPAAWEERKYE
jgi:hypothetical protein